jgi:hypothetical protein
MSWSEIMQHGVWIFSFLAAILWFWAGLVQMPSHIGAIALIGGRVDSNDFQVLTRGLRTQGRLNSCAAFCAGTAAVLQGALHF